MIGVTRKIHSFLLLPLIKIFCIEIHTSGFFEVSKINILFTQINERKNKKINSYIYLLRSHR